MLKNIKRHFLCLIFRDQRDERRRHQVRRTLAKFCYQPNITHTGTYMDNTKGIQSCCYKFIEKLWQFIEKIMGSGLQNYFARTVTIQSKHFTIHCKMTMNSLQNCFVKLWQFIAKFYNSLQNYKEFIAKLLRRTMTIHGKCLTSIAKLQWIHCKILAFLEVFSLTLAEYPWSNKNNFYITLCMYFI